MIYLYFLNFRGSSSNQAEAFRSHYSKLSELRSLTYNQVPVVALTATATVESKDYIIQSLGMFQPEIFRTTPERNNIRYSVVNISTRDPDDIVKPIIEDLNTNLYTAKKIVIFCRLMGDVRRIYKLFDSGMKKRFNDYKSRPYARFHSKTDETIKEHVLNEFTKENGTVRVLVATIAFGMGVDCKSLYHVLHFGPPGALDDYFQESGRAGRDGTQSEAIMIVYPKCYTKNVSPSVKFYAKNQVLCRRALLLKEFGEEKPVISPAHLCCDICTEKCLCAGNSCRRKLAKDWWRISGDKKNNQVHVKKNYLDENGKKNLKRNLEELRTRTSKQQGHCGSAINSGFPISAINQIIDIASPDISRLDLKKHSSLLNEEIFDDIIKVIIECCAASKPDTKENESDESESGESDSKSESSDSENEGVSNSDYRAIIVSLDEVDF